VKVEPHNHTFNEKIYIKNINNYELAISGKKKNKYNDDANTFDYQIEQPVLTKKIHDTKKYESSDFNFKLYDNPSKYK
jgi:hypothetical protein